MWQRRGFGGAFLWTRRAGDLDGDVTSFREGIETMSTVCVAREEVPRSGPCGRAGVLVVELFNQETFPARSVSNVHARRIHDHQKGKGSWGSSLKTLKIGAEQTGSEKSRHVIFIIFIFVRCMGN